MNTPDETATSPPSRSTSPKAVHNRERSVELFGKLAAAEKGSAPYARARDELVELHMPLVEYLARRFRNRGEPFEDLVQVATIGLIKSIDRFDPEREIEFSSFATPTIVGEVKRHFRDKGWIVRVPRHLQELKMAIDRGVNALSQDIGRSPTVKELAAHLKLSEEEVIQGLEAARAYSAVSLDAPPSEESSPSIADTLGFNDSSMENIELRESLRPALEKLNSRERTILNMRFVAGKTQNQIAEELGISQMHVSRLLAKSLVSMRESFSENDMS